MLCVVPFYFSYLKHPALYHALYGQQGVLKFLLGKYLGEFPPEDKNIGQEQTRKDSKVSGNRGQGREGRIEQDREPSNRESSSRYGVLRSKASTHSDY